MKREDIEKEISSRLDEPDNEWDAIFNSGFSRGFRAAVDWRINSVWNEPTIEAIRDEDILIEDVRGKFTVHKFYLEKWENMVKVYEIKRWAYVKDLISKTKE